MISRQTLKKIGIVLLLLAAGTYFIATYLGTSLSQIPLVFSNRTMLSGLWHTYKLTYLEPGTGRTLDKQRDNITTSEGESYTLLRAVWQDDRETFDQSWNWTKDNLQRSDNLFSWLFGRRPDGSYGVLIEQNGQNAASDADTDIALALLFASSRWREESYREEALAIIDAIWEQEVVIINNRPVLTANNVEKNSAQAVLVNPSYFSPHAYRIFAKVDPDRSHNWNALVENSYDVIQTAGAATLDKPSGFGLPPDWITINRRTGAIQASRAPDQTTNYGFEAARLPWRIALDYQWHGDEQARATSESWIFLSDQWKTNRALASSYARDGSVVSAQESPFMYGGSLGALILQEPHVARQVYDNKLKVLYNPDTQSWKAPLGYYDDNWAWFGIALYTNNLPNLAKNI